MPFVTVDHAAGISQDQKRALQASLTAAVVEAFGSVPGSVRVYTRAIDPDDVYCGDGNHTAGLPVIRAEFLEGRSFEQKKALIAALARAAAGALEVPVAQIRTILFDKLRKEWGRGESSMADT